MSSVITLVTAILGFFWNMLVKPVFGLVSQVLSTTLRIPRFLAVPLAAVLSMFCVLFLFKLSILSLSFILGIFSFAWLLIPVLIFFGVAWLIWR